MTNTTNTSSFTNSASASRSRKTLSNAEISELIDRSKNGDIEARNMLLEANINLIRKIARQVKNPNADFEDLVIDGCIRFLEIINDFDPSKGFTISTFIWRPVLQAMHKGVYGYKKNIGSFLLSKKEAVEYLTNKLDHKPTDQEIADCMGISLKVYKKRIDELTIRSEVSIDSPVNSSESDSVTVQDFLPSLEDSAAEFLEKEERTAINLAWSRLSSRDQNILTFRDLPNGERMSLREAAEKSGIGRETIRNNEKKAKNTFQEILREYGVYIA